MSSRQSGQIAVIEPRAAIYLLSGRRRRQATESQTRGSQTV
jgi:hypothetical protein